VTNYVSTGIFEQQKIPETRVRHENRPGTVFARRPWLTLKTLEGGIMSKAAGLVCVCVLIAACSSQASAPTAPLQVPVFTQSAAPQSNGGNFGTPLAAEEEVMPVVNGVRIINTSNARGSAVFQLSADGTQLDYQLMVANIDNAFMAHIHRAAKGVNGGIVVWLFPSTTPNVTGPLGAGRIDGVIASGTITAANLVGSLAGHPLSDLVNEITAGNTYVNVHTNDNVAPTNTGPGDFPGGEIRGQLEHRGH
jgi:hypothetical protein